MRYSQDATNIIHTAAVQARSLGHSFVGSVHLLGALSQGRDMGALLLRQWGGPPEFVRDVAVVFYGRGNPELPLPQGFSAHAAQILETAGHESVILGDRLVRPIHILIALIRHSTGSSAAVLEAAGVNADELFTVLLDRVLMIARAVPKVK